MYKAHCSNLPCKGVVFFFFFSGSFIWGNEATWGRNPIALRGRWGRWEVGERWCNAGKREEMATCKALGIIYRFQVNRGRNSPVCHPYSGIVERTIAQALLWEKGCVGLGPSRCHSGKLKSHFVLIKVIALGNRGCNIEETPPPSSDHALASPILGLPCHTSHANEGSSGRTFGRGVREAETIGVVSSRRLFGKPNMKKR